MKHHGSVLSAAFFSHPGWFAMAGEPPLPPPNEPPPGPSTPKQKVTEQTKSTTEVLPKAINSYQYGKLGCKGTWWMF